MLNNLNLKARFLLISYFAISFLVNTNLQAQTPLPDSTDVSRAIETLEQVYEYIKYSDTWIVPNPEPSDSITAPSKYHFEICYNGSIELDQVILEGSLTEKCIRSFILFEKVLPAYGVIPNGGLILRDHTLVAIPRVFRPVSTFDGTFYENHFRFKKLAAATDFLIGAPEVIVDIDGTYRDFPNKNWLLWEYGTTEEEQYLKIKEHFYKFLLANGDSFDAIEIGNEPWGMCLHEWQLIERARIDAFIQYNQELGRFEIEDMRPLLGTVALPIGQGGKYKLQLPDLVTEYAPYYHYVSAHIYPFDNQGQWTTDWTYATGQIGIAEAFRQQNFPNAEFWITETGSKYEEISFYGEIFRYCENIPSVKRIIPYTYTYIENDKFGDLHMIDSLGNETDTYRYLKNF